MDPFGLQEANDGLRTRSFRNEDYNNRRVFLRSYPLHWGNSEEEDERQEDHRQNKVDQKRPEDVAGNKSTTGDIRKPIKKIILSIFHWGEERVIVLKRFKNKVTIYVIACYPVGFKPRTAFISA